MEPLQEFARTASFGNLRETSLCSLLGIRDVPLIRPQDLPSYLRRCQADDSPLALQAAFWLLHQMARRRQLDSLYGAAAVDLLISHGLLTEVQPDVLSAVVDLYPCLGTYVFTDALLARTYEQGHVYQLGTDSYVLARVTPRKKAKRALDLCTGSGIHAILAAFDHEESIGVDLNPRALMLSKLNAKMNGRTVRGGDPSSTPEVGDQSSDCEFLQGDLYEPVRGQFDLITANPPFVPTPDTQMLIHRTGGETGEEISERLVAGLPEHLAPGGTFSMILDFPVMSGSTYLQRIESWLGGLPGWGIAVLNFGHVSRESYIKDHVDSSGPDYFDMYAKYLESYDRLGIVAVGFANVFVRRLPEGHPGFAVERVMVNPYVAIDQQVESWLQALEKQHDPRTLDWDGWKPRVTAWVADTWLNQAGDRGAIEFTDNGWSAPASCTGSVIQMLRRCDGTHSARELGGTAEQFGYLQEILAIS